MMDLWINFICSNNPASSFCYREVYRMKEYCFQAVIFHTAIYIEMS